MGPAFLLLNKDAYIRSQMNELFQEVFSPGVLHILHFAVQAYRNSAAMWYTMQARIRAPQT